MTRVAAVDIGTNSTRLLIADVEGGELTEVDRRSTVTRLGEGVDATRRLQPDPIERTRAVLDGYRGEIEERGVVQTLVVATSAVRDAANGADFMHDVGASYGFATRILSGDEEAALTRRGVGAMGEATLLLDVGGGSTELTVGDFRISLDVGSVRLTERFLHGDPPTTEELEAAGAFTRGLLPDLEVDDAVGVAGTVTQLHILIGELTREAVERELRQLATMPLAARSQLPGMDPARAPVIVGGAVVVAEVLRRYELARLGWSIRDLLDGAALEAATMV